MRVQDVTVNESSPAILLCENLRPSDAVDYSWEKDGETLPNEFFADLQLPPVSRTDAGNYTCVAANSFGLTRETGWLAVQCECPGGKGVWSAAVGMVGDGKGAWSAAVGMVGDGKGAWSAAVGMVGDGKEVWSAAVGVVGDGKGAWSAAVGMVGDGGGSSNYKLGPNAVFVCCVCQGKGAAQSTAHMTKYMFCSDFQLHFRFGSGGCVPASNCSGWRYSICASGL